MRLQTLYVSKRYTMLFLISLLFALFSFQGFLPRVPGERKMGWGKQSMFSAWLYSNAFKQRSYLNSQLDAYFRSPINFNTLLHSLLLNIEKSFTVSSQVKAKHSSSLNIKCCLLCVRSLKYSRKKSPKIQVSCAVRQIGDQNSHILTPYAKVYKS